MLLVNNATNFVDFFNHFNSTFEGVRVVIRFSWLLLRWKAIHCADSAGENRH